MEAFFDNKTNIISARICAVLDEAVMYSLQTQFSGAFQDRVRTVVRDENAVGAAGTRPIVAAINWKDKTFEINGQKRPCSELKRSVGPLFNKRKFWRWSEERKEYEISYTHEEWKVTIEDGKTIAGRFLVPFRPHLFSKTKPAVIHLTTTALAEDEVFLILVFVYEETKRQDKTNTTPLGGR
ncbi:hypothetical protein FB45DRAFT_933501 [Roridomyces roridus]|uniref:Uncharacterized protein n=1 Tax=Roridomyces roridus TaxID=1738132 RepID=A0AAD7BCD9_9AGAR|nr:hypothetical protein FB45DRAFT_933501 [Roridomyces roridus]